MNLQTFSLKGLISLVLILCLSYTSSIANPPQEVTVFQADAISTASYAKSTILNESLTAYSLYQFDIESLYDFAQKSKDSALHFQLNLGEDYALDINLETNQIDADDAQLVLITEDGDQQISLPASMTYKGQTALGLENDIRMTIDKDFLMGYFVLDGQEYFLESAAAFTQDKNQALNNYYVFYEGSAAKASNTSCGATHVYKEKEKIENQYGKGGMACLKAELAVAVDFKYYQKYNSNTTTTKNRIATVFNMVEAIYASNIDIDLDIKGYYISKCFGCDPWDSTTHANTLLNSFRDWGNGGGFGLTYDVASLWTTRDIWDFVEGSVNTGVAGIASVGALCGSSRYNVNEEHPNFSAGVVKNIWAHELGHNFGASHDDDSDVGCPSGFIMASSVGSGNTNFSSCSKNAMNNHINSVNCLSACSSGACGAPTANEISINVINNHTVTINWPNKNAAFYVMEYRVQGFSHWAGRSTTTNSITISDLYGVSNVWEFRLRTHCTTSQYYFSPIKTVTVTNKNNSMTLANEIAVNIFPNPVANSFRISYTGEAPLTEDLKLYNTQGQLVKTFDVSQINRSINISDLDNGIYILRINDMISKRISKL